MCAAELKGDLLNLKEAQNRYYTSLVRKITSGINWQQKSGLVMVISLLFHHLNPEKADEMTSAVYQLLQEYQLSESKAFCCDTKTSNTDRINGVLLKQKLEKDLLYLTCL